VSASGRRPMPPGIDSRRGEWCGERTLRPLMPLGALAHLPMSRRQSAPLLHLGLHREVLGPRVAVAPHPHDSVAFRAAGGHGQGHRRGASGPHRGGRPGSRLSILVRFPAWAWGRHRADATTPEPASEMLTGSEASWLLMLICRAAWTSAHRVEAHAGLVRTVIRSLGCHPYLPGVVLTLIVAMPTRSPAFTASVLKVESSRGAATGEISTLVPVRVAVSPEVVSGLSVAPSRVKR